MFKLNSLCLCMFLFWLVTFIIIFLCEHSSCSCLSKEDRYALDCAAFNKKSSYDKLSQIEISSIGKLTCNNRSVISHIKRSPENAPIYYLSTSEGFASHMLQYNVIWNWGRAVNRSVITFDFESSIHYGSNYYVSVCDIFHLPKTFKCLRHDRRKQVVNDSNCVIFRMNFPEFKLNTSISPVCEDVNIYNLSCLAGLLYFWDKPDTIHLYPPVRFLLFRNFTFRHYYEALFNERITNTLRINMNSTMVFHWRRGDQLRTRCIEVHDHDKSINCRPVGDFVELVNRTSMKLASIVKSPTIYISTNEENSTTLGKIHMKIVFPEAHLLLSIYRISSFERVYGSVQFMVKHNTLSYEI